MMLLVEPALKGYAVEANEGSVGGVHDCLFDQRSWKLRWLVVDTGGWLTGHKVLIHPSAIGRPDIDHARLPVHLTRAQIKASPEISFDLPVSEQMEGIYGYYGWDPQWGGGGYFAGYPGPLGEAKCLTVPVRSNASRLGRRRSEPAQHGSRQRISCRGHGRLNRPYRELHDRRRQLGRPLPHHRHARSNQHGENRGSDRRPETARDHRYRHPQHATSCPLCRIRWHSSIWARLSAAQIFTTPRHKQTQNYVAGKFG